jgi:histidine triad (HIT) family protein
VIQDRHMENCLFCKIIAKEIPAQIVFEDESIIAFLDINPVQPGHTLVVPKSHSGGLHDAVAETLDQLIRATQKIAHVVTQAMEAEGFNVELNNGAVAGQLIPHLHFHIIPRRENDGCVGGHGTPYADGVAERVAEKIRSAF